MSQIQFEEKITLPFSSQGTCSLATLRSLIDATAGYGGASEVRLHVSRGMDQRESDVWKMTVEKRGTTQPPSSGGRPMETL